MINNLTKQQKYNILNGLINLAEKEHPKFQEENITGKDLMDGAKLFLKEFEETDLDKKMKGLKDYKKSANLENIVELAPKQEIKPISEIENSEANYAMFLKKSKY